MKRAFYRLLLWLTERDLAVATATGRNPECVENLSKRLQEHTVTLFNLDHSLFDR